MGGSWVSCAGARGAGAPVSFPSYELFGRAHAAAGSKLLFPAPLCRQLRDKFNVQRRDVWAPGTEPEEGSDSESEEDEDGEGGLGNFSPD